ncbi:hypothetical protein ASZ90_017315 [hydrocarbon metagenome]|uniref:Glutaredoxin domain-containing protein n=1 Tax=hydrocarbon metagenome TaxID=938273 RepID=A0A0W8E9C4_9ZZZZ
MDKPKKILNNKQLFQKEAVINTLIFILIISILLYADFGMLTGLGILAALLGIYFSLSLRYLFVAMIGVCAASSSFIGQSMVAYCPYCTAAAMCFLIAGTISLMRIASKYTFISLVLCGVTLVSVGMFTWSFTAYADTREPVIHNGQATMVAKERDISKPKLYLSTTCPSCKGVIADFVNNDPLGEKWLPVVVPHSNLAQGEKMLQELGYQGEVVSASYPPGNRLPTLDIQGEIFVGSKIEFEEIAKGETK